MTTRPIQRVRILPDNERGQSLADLDAVLELDCSLHETHQLLAETTDHPVEQGADITDHVRRKPDQVTIEGLVSNVPILTQGERDLAGEQPPRASGRADSAHSRLRDICNGRLVRVITTLRDYRSMMCVSSTIPREAQLGDVFQFTATFKEIRTVASETIELRTATPSGQPKTKLGKKTPDEAPKATADKSRSALKHVTDALGFTTPGSGVTP